MPEIEQSVAYLRLLSDPALPAPRQTVYALSSGLPTALGRDFRCHIVLDPTVHRSVSRRHIEIRAYPNATDPPHFRWELCDLGSRNGTFVNGTRLTGSCWLQSGDRIGLGQHGPEFIFDYTPTPPPAPSQSVPSGGTSVSTVPAPRSAAPPSRPPAPRSVASVPRGAHDSVSLTQLFPILSTGRELARKAYLLPAGITILFVVLLFLAIGNAIAFNFLLASYLAGAAYYFIYQLCGKHKPWWIITTMILLTAILLITPVFVFPRLLPGDLANVTEPINPVVLLLKMFFGAGLMEEILKALPVLLALWLGSRLAPPLRHQIGVWEPLDGILLGAAAAVGFCLMETLGVYVPAIYQSALGSVGADAAQLAGLQLLIPRVLGLVAGHMAYSGYLGYFIGLSALRRRQRRLILTVGLLTAAGLHTLWNAAGLISPIALMVVGSISYAFLGAAILKARSLSPTRSQNFATRLIPPP